jgi:hypothetical protein
MRLFKCQSCGQAVFFENRYCEKCGHGLGFLSEKLDVLALEPDGEVFTPVKSGAPRLRYCHNAQQDGCNWLIQADSPGRFCTACRHNRTIPDLLEGENLIRWQKMESAKRRLFYTLISLGLPLRNFNDDKAHGLTFDFLAEIPAGPKILTGHDEGLITINLIEADDAAREKLRSEMHEPYRTLLGHFRHEIGHYFWDVLVRDAGREDACRAIFGDDRQDYAQALQNYYAQGAPANWQNSFISAYATAHPWEDFAESWAHYLHIVDTLETATAFGLGIHPVAIQNSDLHADMNFNPHRAISAQVLIDAWLPLTFAMNNLNRSMGQADLYPFVVSEPVIAKLQFIHEIIHAGDAEKAGATPPKKGFSGRKPLVVAQQAQSPEQPPSQPPAPPGPPPILPPVEPPVIEPPEEAPPVELPPQEVPPPPVPGEPPPLRL